jgi:hypothetical protein
MDASDPASETPDTDRKAKTKARGGWCCCGHREHLEMNEQQKLILAEMEKVASYMDVAWQPPFMCGYRVGMDGLAGFLIPGAGDVMTAMVSIYIITRIFFVFDNHLFWRKWPILFMNILIDMTVGAIPFLGDFFDVGWKSNIRNINIIRKHYGMEPLVEEPPAPAKTKNEKNKKRSSPLEQEDV